MGALVLDMRRPSGDRYLSKVRFGTGISTARSPRFTPSMPVVSADHQKRERPAHKAGRSEPSLQPRRGRVA
jgi:hypothetical protein